VVQHLFGEQEVWFISLLLQIFFTQIEQTTISVLDSFLPSFLQVYRERERERERVCMPMCRGGAIKMSS